MKLNKMNKEDLELLSYTDLTEMILSENQTPLKTPDIFKKICDLLELADEEYVNKIGDYYTSLTTDKRFIFLEDGTWDLKHKHKVEINLEDDEEIDEDIESDEDEPVEPNLEYDVIAEGVDEDDDDVDDEIEGFEVIDEDNIDEE